MNILSKTLDHIKFTIPIEILNLAFQDSTPNWRQSPGSLDDKILNTVIRPRVLVDCDLVSGMTVIVSLEGLVPSYIDTYTMSYVIPADRLSYRNIIAVLSVGYLPFSQSYNALGSGIGTVSPSSMVDTLSAAQRVGDSMSNIPAISNASIELVGYNTVLIRDQLRITNSYQARMVLANAEDLSNISQRSYPAFYSLCELAIKSYIYNKMLIAIDSAYIQGGIELGSVKSYIESLSDAETMYQTYLRETWRPVAYFSDNLAHTRMIKLMISPGI